VSLEHRRKLTNLTTLITAYKYISTKAYGAVTLLLC